MATKHDNTPVVASTSRRRFLKTTTAVAGASLGPLIIVSKNVSAQSKGQVIVRGLGGAYQDAMDKALYKPFTQETGINVIVQASNAAQIRAMVEAKRVRIDVADLVDTAQIALDNAGALAPIAYSKMQYTKPTDIHASVRKPNMVGNLYFATVLTYNTDVFKSGTHPTSWAEFWDITKFPGARTLADQKAGSAELEFALLADGVAMDKLYPINIARALASLDRIKSNVSKWWDTGAVSAQLLERKEAVVGGLWNGRAQALIDQGAPLAIEWNQAKRQTQCLSIIKDSPNQENAQLFVDFALQPKVQAEITKYIAYGPTNDAAIKIARPEDLAKTPSAPAYLPKGFTQDAQWWADNLSKVGEQWQSWVLRRS